MTRQIPWLRVFVEGVVIVGSILLAFGLEGCGPSPNEQLVGAWLITETTVTTPDSTSTNSSPQPGLYIFTDRHFSNMLIQGSERRALLSDTRSAEERLAAYDVFIADAGSYEFTDSLLTMHNIIAKVPNVMTGTGPGITYRYHLYSDTLELTFERGWAPPGGQLMYRLVRLR